MLLLLAPAGLIWLNSGLPTLPLPWFNLGLALAAVLLLPGWLLMALLLPSIHPGSPAKLPLAFSLGLGLLAPAAVIALYSGAPLTQFGWMVVSLNLLLFGLWWRRRPAEPLARAPQTRAPFNPYLLGLVLLAGLGALLLYGRTAGTFTAGDAPTYLLYLRHYLDQPLTTAISPLPVETLPAGPRAINGWWVVLALLARLSHANLLNVYFWLLPPLLMSLSLLALYSLAATLFKNSNAALLAVLLQLLYAASSVNSHDWLGRGFFDRIIEDKFLIWLLLLPVAQLLVLHYLQTGESAPLLALGLSVTALALTHPIGVAQFGISTLAFALVFVGFQRSRQTIWRAILLAAPLLLVIVVPWLQRYLLSNTGVAFQYSAGDIGQFDLSQTRLWLFSALDNLFMLHPHQVAHPLAVLAIVLTPLLIFYLRYSVAAQFLLANSVVTLLLLFNPLTAPLLGQVITPWMLWRISWLLPVALTLAFCLDKLSGAINRWLALNPASLRAAFPPMVALVVLALALAPYLVDSQRILAERPVLSLTLPAWDVLAQLSNQTNPGEVVLASNELSTMIPAFTSRVKVLFFRWETEESPQVDSFYQTRLLTPATLRLLESWQVKFIIIEHDRPLAFQLAGLPAYFGRRYQNETYALYEVLPRLADDPTLTGNSALLQGQFERAEAAYRQALAAEPANSAAGYGLGLSLQAQNQLDAVREVWQKLLTFQPDHLPARLALARLYQQTGQFEAAQTELEQARARWPASLEAAELLGDVYLAQGRTDAALGAYNQAVLQPPAVATGQYHLALAGLFRRKGLTAQAQTEFQTVIELDSLPAIGLRPGGLLGVRNSVVDFRLARLAQAHTALAQLQEQADDSAAAETEYRQALTEVTNYQPAYAGLANLYRAGEHPDKVIDLYRLAGRRNPNLAWPHLELGRLYLDRMKDDPAP